MSYTRRYEIYNELSERIEAIPQLHCTRHRWTHLGEDLHDNQQKLFCHTNSGEEYIIRAEYLDAETAILYVEEIKYIESAFQAIKQNFPNTEIVGDKPCIRVCILNY